MRRLISTSVLVLGLSSGSLSQNPPDRTYTVYVASEAADRVSRIRFGPDGLQLERSLPVGIMPTDIDGPHGLTLAPDGRFYYVSLAHGQPNGTVWKLSATDDRVVGRVALGMFPATMDLTPDGDFLYVVNFNLHGNMVPSSVSIVSTNDMLEIARLDTCTMPHGSRINRAGTKHYSACMMDEQLVEIDTQTLKVSRHFILTRGKEIGMSGSPMNLNKDHREHVSGAHGTEAPKPGDNSCSPTWAQPSSSGSSVFVACNASSEIVEVAAATWQLKRRIEAGPGVYNLATTADDRLIATNRRDQSVSVFDLKTGKELARVPTKRRIVHGVAVSKDDKYAFISVEGIAAEPGTVEVLDLQSLKIVANLDVDPQAGGIDVVR